MQKNNEKLFTIEFLMITCLNFLIMTGNSIISTLYSLHLEDIGKNDSQTGLIMGISALAGIASRILMGPRIDEKGRMFFLRTGAGLIILCTLLYSLPFRSDIYLIAVRIIHGFGWGAYFTSVFTWVADYAPEGRMAEAIGMFGISGLLPNAVGPQLGEYILRIGSNNFNYLFAASATLILIGLIISIWLRDVNHKGIANSGHGVLKLFAKPEVFSVCFAGFIFGFGVSTVFTFMAPFTRAANLGVVAPFFTAYTTGSITMRLLTGRAADRLGRHTLIIPAFIIMSLGQTYVQYIDTLFELMGVGFCLGSAHGMVYAAMTALTMDRVGNENRGKGMGLFNAVSDVGFFLGGVIPGYIAYKSSFGMMFSVNSIAIITGLLAFVIMESMLKNKKELLV